MAGLAPALFVTVVAALLTTSGSASPDPFPADQALTALAAESTPPAYIGSPVKVVAVRTEVKSPVRTPSGVRTYPTSIMWERVARDGGDRRFLLVRAPSSSVLCGFFTSLFTAKRATEMQRACKSQGKPNLNVYAEIDYRVMWRGPLPGNRRWHASTTDGKSFDDNNRPPRTRVGARSVREIVVMPLEPGRYDVRVDAIVRLGTHPVFSEVKEGLDFVEDYLETPLEFLAGPAGWLAGTLKDEALEAMVTTAVDRYGGTRSVWSFEVPAVVPDVTKKTPQGARNLLRLHRLQPAGTREIRVGTGSPKVTAQTLAPGTLTRAGTTAGFTFAVFERASTAPGTRPGPWHGDWRWTYIPTGGTSATPGVMTMFQPSPTRVCLQWPWSPLPNGTLGNGSASPAATARTMTFKHQDAFGSGTHTVSVSADGGSLTGRYEATARVGGAKATGTVSAEYVGPPSKRPSC